MIKVRYMKPVMKAEVKTYEEFKTDFVENKNPLEVKPDFNASYFLFEDSPTRYIIGQKISRDYVLCMNLDKLTLKEDDIKINNIQINFEEFVSTFLEILEIVSKSKINIKKRKYEKYNERENIIEGRILFVIEEDNQIIHQIENLLYTRKSKDKDISDTYLFETFIMLKPLIDKYKCMSDIFVLMMYKKYFPNKIELSNEVSKTITNELPFLSEEKADKVYNLL